MPPELRVRRLRQDDAERIQAFVRGLSAHTRAERYFAPIRELSPRQLDRLTGEQDSRNLVLAVTAGRSIVALGECFDGEFAVVVADGWQGMGIGEALILAILAHAADMRLPLVHGLVRERNRPMLRLARRLGFRLAAEVEPGLMRVEKPNRAPAPMSGREWGLLGKEIPIKEVSMAGIPRRQGRAEPKIGPSDSSDTFSDRPNESTDTDDGGTGERVTTGPDPHSELHNERGVDRVVDSKDAGLGGGLDQAEEGRLGVTDEEIEDLVRKPKP